jgi:hypothetical protein
MCKRLAGMEAEQCTRVEQYVHVGYCFVELALEKLT